MSTAVVKGLGGGNQLRQAAYTYINTLEQSSPPHAHKDGQDTPPAVQTPEKKLTDHLRSAANTLFDYVDRTNFATLGTIGMIGILFSVVLVLSHIESAMNVIWKAPNSRSIVRKISDYLTLLILLPISINVAFAASAFLANPQLAMKANILIPVVWIQALLLKLLPVFFIALTLYVIYIFFPNTKVKSLPAVFGATLAAILWFSVQNVYISLQIGVAKYNAIYGSFATFPLFLIWMYLGWIFILTGAQIAYAFQNIKSYSLFKLPEQPSQDLAAAFDIMDIIYSSFAEKNSLTASDICLQLHEYSETVVQKVISQLLDGGMIHLSCNDDQLLPSEPAENFKHQTVISIILGADAPDTPGGEQSLQMIRGM
jgi:membrane protein